MREALIALAVLACFFGVVAMGLSLLRGWYGF